MDWKRLPVAPLICVLTSVLTVVRGHVCCPLIYDSSFISFSNGKKLEQIVQTHRTSYLSGWPRGSSKIQSSLLNIYFRLCGFHASPRSCYSLPLRSQYPAAFTLQQSVAQSLSDMWRSTSSLARRSFTQLQKSHQKLLFLYVSRSPIWYGFHASAKAIRYRVNKTLEKGGEQVTKHDIE